MPEYEPVHRGTPRLAVAAAIFRRGHVDAAATPIGVPGTHPHEPRHPAASQAIAAGADVKVVQQLFGPAFVTMTMDVYGHLFESRLDEVADALDRARAQSEVDEDQWTTAAEGGQVPCPSERLRGELPASRSRRGRGGPAATRSTAP